MSKFFGSVNKVDFHNKPRQYNLGLENYLVNQCNWIWLCKTVSMEITIANLWKLFCCGVKRDQFEKLVGIR